MLTATQEDYLEAIFSIERTGGDVHISLLADHLGCRLPTVTRTVQKLVEMGYVDHKTRGTVHLTGMGRYTAKQLAHRHEDLVRFLVSVLGMSQTDAETDACQLEHGMSRLAAQRMHQWLIHIERLVTAQRDVLFRFEGRDDTAVPDFHRLPGGKTAGWRA
jgi:DtxR family Mn-dependent transcriptional regulator